MHFVYLMFSYRDICYWTTLFREHGISTVHRTYAYNAEASPNENISVQPYQNHNFLIILEFVSAAVFRRNNIVRKNTVCHKRTTNTKIRLYSMLN